eukprot:4549399-Karenia_brevis.AAC.1
MIFRLLEDKAVCSKQHGIVLKQIIAMNPDFLLAHAIAHLVPHVSGMAGYTYETHITACAE